VANVLRATPSRAIRGAPRRRNQRPARNRPSEGRQRAALGVTVAMVVAGVAIAAAAGGSLWILRAIVVPLGLGWSAMQRVLRRRHEPRRRAATGIGAAVVLAVSPS
jgi:hypothetical protein